MWIFKVEEMHQEECEDETSHTVLYGPFDRKVTIKALISQGIAALSAIQAKK